MFFLTTLIVWLLSKAKIISAGRAALLMCNCAALTMSGFMVNVLERIMGVELEFSGDPLPPSENAIVISNHITNMDVFCILAYQVRPFLSSNSTVPSRHVWSRQVHVQRSIETVIYS